MINHTILSDRFQSILRKLLNKLSNQNIFSKCLTYRFNIRFRWVFSKYNLAIVFEIITFLNEINMVKSVFQSAFITIVRLISLLKKRLQYLSKF